MKKVTGILGFLIALNGLAYLFISLLNGHVIEAQSDGQDGTFDVVGYNNAPTFESFVGPDTNGATLTPNQTYTVSLEVQDIDGLSDLKTVDLVMYYLEPQPTSLSALETTFDTITTTALDGTAVIMRWQNTATSAAVNSASGITGGASDDLPDASFHIVSESSVGSDITWEILNTTVPALSGSAIPGNTFTFEIEFKVSKVARQAAQSQWRFGARIEDARTIESFVAAEQINDGSTSVATLESSNSPVATGTSIQVSDRYNMAFYGEVNVPSSAALTWTDLSPGVLFTDEEVVSLSGINFIANNTHNMTAKSESFWTATGSAVNSNGVISQTDGNQNYTGASLTAELMGSTTEQKFRLGVDTSSTYNPDTILLLDDTFTAQTIEFAGPTDERGNAKTYYFFIELANLFYDADYIGDIIIGISNRITTE